MKLIPPLLIALSLVAPAGVALAQAAAPAASAASAPANAVRQEVYVAMQAVQELFKTNQWAPALARVDQALAQTATPSPYETAVMQRARGLVLLQLQRVADALPALEAALATNALTKEEQLQLQAPLARGHFQVKNYPAALEWMRRAVAAGNNWAGLPAVRARAVYLSGDYPGAVREFESVVNAYTTTPPPDEDLRLLASAYSQVKDFVGYTRVLERLMRDYPRPEYWADMLARVPRVPNWQARWDVDIYRLRLQVGEMKEAADYVELAELANKAGLPVEAQQVMEAGYAKGLLGSGSGAAEHQKLRITVSKLADDDRKNLATPPAKPPTIADGRSAATALSTGFALVTVGQTDRGLELMKAAVASPQIADAAYGRLQLALALQRAGRTAEALEGFKALGTHEGLGLLARLWVIALTPKKG